MSTLGVAVIYCGTAIFGTVMCASYYFGHNIVWKSELDRAKQEIINSENQHHELLAKKIDLQNEKIDLQNGKIDLQIEALKIDLTKLDYRVERMDKNIEDILAEIKKPMK